MADSEKANEGRTKPRRIAPRDLEKKILERLDPDRVMRSRDLAKELGRSPGTVHDACRRLYENNEVRLSKVPNYLYRFLLTGDVLHRGNYPVVTRLVALANSAALRGAIRPELKRIFATLRRESGLRTGFHQDYIARCESAAAKAGGEAALRDRISLQPFRSLVTYWWPTSIETQYVRPMTRVMKNLDKRRIQTATRRMVAATSAVRGETAGNPGPDAEKAAKASLEALERYAEVDECLEDSGARELLKSRDVQLTSIASRDTIPDKDLQVVSQKELDGCIDAVHGVPRGRYQDADGRLLGMTRGELRELLREAMESSAAAARRPPSEKEDRGWRKWLLSSLKLGIGGSLVVADFSLGFGPLSGLLLSAGGGQVGIAISVMSSIHAGAKTVVEALDRMRRPASK